MKIVGIRSALPAALLATIFSTASRAQETAVSPDALQAKIQSCKTCHGSSGQGSRGSSPIPRLAGQQAVYIDNQLKAFAERRRANANMNEVAHDLAAEMRIALARYFSNLKASPLGGAPRELVAAGRKVYQEGVPDAKVVPCRLCHGEAAHGDAFIPRLAGQLHDYMINKLVDWRRERGLEPSKRDASSIMEPIVHGLTQPPIEAVAAYLSYLD